MLAESHSGRRADDQQRHPHRPQWRSGHRSQDGKRRDIATEHREGTERREADMGAGTDRHRRGTDHHIGQIQQRQQSQAELAEERVGDPEQFVHGPPVQNQGHRHDRARQREQRRHPDQCRTHSVRQPQGQSQPRHLT